MYSIMFYDIKMPHVLGVIELEFIPEHADVFMFESNLYYVVKALPDAEDAKKIKVDMLPLV